jgi:hypothetical protein
MSAAPRGAIQIATAPPSRNCWTCVFNVAHPRWNGRLTCERLIPWRTRETTPEMGPPMAQNVYAWEGAQRWTNSMPPLKTEDCPGWVGR